MKIRRKIEALPFDDESKVFVGTMKLSRYDRLSDSSKRLIIDRHVALISSLGVGETITHLVKHHRNLAGLGPPNPNKMEFLHRRRHEADLDIPPVINMGGEEVVVWLPQTG